jgi:hypothetical protein
MERAFARANAFFFLKPAGGNAEDARPSTIER